MVVGVGMSDGSLDDVSLANSLADAVSEVDVGPPDYNTWPSDDVVVFGYLAARRLGWDGDLPTHVQHAELHMAMPTPKSVGYHLGAFRYNYDDVARKRHLEEHDRQHPETNRA